MNGPYEVRLLPPVERPHLCTCIDKFAHWPEAIPISDITAKTVAQAFVRSLPQDLAFLPPSLQTVDVSLSQICGKTHAVARVQIPLDNHLSSHF